MAATVRYNGVDVSTATELGKELLKWERKPGYNPKNHQYPMMLYRAVKCKDGVVRATMDEPSQYDYTKETMGLMQRDMDAARSFNLANQKTVMTEDDHAIARGQGWFESMDEAVKGAEQREFKLQDATAQRLIDDRNMSEKARAEARAAEVATEEQVPMIPIARTLKPEHWKTKQKREAEEAKAQAS